MCQLDAWHVLQRRVSNFQGPVWAEIVLHDLRRCPWDSAAQADSLLDFVENQTWENGSRLVVEEGWVPGSVSIVVQFQQGFDAVMLGNCREGANMAVWPFSELELPVNAGVLGRIKPER
eukprot:TRINITY_DN63970_c0_g1_i1.p2 TRINITY_DN63970_c0_g1~~TRINITY_DN63970_c0_g1_i1.p2  ORF type:complete len:119 (+),score=11.65 TRINITY_DN63970_c0_g1_i1:171-527(+)